MGLSDPTAKNFENDIGFAGHRTDTNTSLTYMGARYYDPQLARFISPDSIVPEEFNPQALNRYSYVYNNPVSYTDPTGNRPIAEDPYVVEPTGGYTSGSAPTTNPAGHTTEIFSEFPPARVVDKPQKTVAPPPTVEGSEVGDQVESADDIQPPSQEQASTQPTIYDQIEMSDVIMGGGYREGDTGAALGLLLGKALWGTKGVTFNDVLDAAGTFHGIRGSGLGKRPSLRNNISPSKFVPKYKAKVSYQRRLVRTPLDKLAAMRQELGLPAPGPRSPTLARLDIGGQSFYGMSGKKAIDLTVNPVSLWHAETDVLQ